MGRGHARSGEDDDADPYPGVEGAFFGMPARNVVPKPLQKPHPPLWVASSRRETTMVGARLGMGSLGFAFETPEEMRERTEHYFSLVREECYPIGAAINPALGVVNVLSCFDTDEEAIDKGLEGAQFFAYSLAYYYNPFTGGNHKPGKTNIYQKFIDSPPEQRWGPFGDGFRGFGGFGGALAAEEPKDEVTRALWRAAQRGGCIGTPDFIKDTLRQFENAHDGRSCRRPVRGAEARGCDGLDLPDGDEGDPGVQGAPRGAPEVARATAGGRRVPGKLIDLGRAGPAAANVDQTGNLGIYLPH